MPSRAFSLAALRAEVAGRLSGGGDDRQRESARSRLRHIEAVAATVHDIGRAGNWPDATVEAAVRAAWIHDALKLEGEAAWRARIEAAGEEPDPWATAQQPELLHAQAATVWAAERGEVDRFVLAAVRHHPTAHPGWETVGRLLYVADFAEPTRNHAERADAATLRALAGQGGEGLSLAARRVLAIRLRHFLGLGRAIHPDSWRAWKTWTDGERQVGK
ncbi:MAG TPA: hypothetical protein VM737_08795 [Gemmatimonadota bacterium]|nr:hypothetical protein [Gemmatimonadota bacterium]